jgi:hypothetical protein
MSPLSRTTSCNLESHWKKKDQFKSNIVCNLLNFKSHTTLHRLFGFMPCHGFKPCLASLDDSSKKNIKQKKLKKLKNLLNQPTARFLRLWPLLFPRNPQPSSLDWGPVGEFIQKKLKKLKVSWAPTTAARLCSLYQLQQLTGCNWRQLLFFFSFFKYLY